MKKILEKVWCIANYSNSYIIEFKNFVILVDCGFDKKAKKIIEKLKEINKQLRYILITHSHLDHIYGLYEILKFFPSSKIIAHVNSEEYLAGKKFKLPKGLKGYFFRLFIPFLNYRGIESYIKLNGDKEIEKGINAIYTPGHTEDHMCYLIEDKLFIGDLIMNEKKLSLVPKEFNDNEEEIKKVLKKLLQFEFNEIYFGHGKPLTTNAKEELKNFLKEIY